MHPSDSASCLGVASAAPSANSFSFFLLLYNVAPLHSQTLSLSAHFVFHCPSFLCVCLYSLPGAVEGTLPSFRGGRGWCSIKEKGHLSGVRARTNNSPRPPFPPHSAESLCIKYIVCSPLHSFFFFSPPFLFPCGSGRQQLLRTGLFVCGMHLESKTHNACRGK